MSIENNIKKHVTDLRQVAGDETDIDKKLDELIDLLQKSDIDSEKASEYQLRFDNAIKRRGIQTEQIEAFQNLDNRDASREELLDEFSMLLSSNQFDSRVNKRRTKKIISEKRLSNIVLFVISLVLIFLGFGMIIMPAPPFFEMFTIYYFSQDDGITIMDVISLLIILAGIYFLIKAIYRNSARR